MLIPYQCPYCQNTTEGEYQPERAKLKCKLCGRERDHILTHLEKGTLIGNGYRILGKLDENSQSQIYLAYQEAMDRKVVLKVLPPGFVESSEAFQRFQREIKVAAAIQHPNILAAYGAGEDGGIYYLIRQYKPGKTLEELCRQGPLPEKEVLRRLRSIAEALHYAWEEHHILHRNIKPENILFADDGTTMLSDLGIAKPIDKEELQITQLGFTVGTPEYMSPEQVKGIHDLDCRSDIYSFCIVLYQALTGEVPFSDRSPIAVMEKQLTEPHIPVQFRNPKVSTVTSQLVDKGLKKNREERFSSWKELIEAMKAAEAGEDLTFQKKKGKEKISKSAPSSKPRIAYGNPAIAPRLNRQDIEQIAEKMLGAKYRRDRVILYALVVFLPICIAGLLFFFYLRHSAVQRIQLLELQGKELTEQKKYTLAIEKYQELLQLLPSSDVEKRELIENKIKECQINDILHNLELQASPYLQRGDYKMAIYIYQNYKGQYAVETAGARQAKIEEIQRMAKSKISLP